MTNNLSVSEYNNTVKFSNGSQTVGDSDHGSMFYLFQNIFHNNTFGHIVQC